MLELVTVELRTLKCHLGFCGISDSKESACNAGDLSLIPELRKPPGEGNDYPLQYSCLENPMNRGAHQATAYEVIKSWKQLKRLVQNWEGVCQGCILSPCLFNLYADYIM